MARTTANDYGTPGPVGASKMRPLLTALHALHLISSIIVMSIAAYFIAHWKSNTHLRYWVALVSLLSPTTA